MSSAEDVGASGGFSGYVDGDVGDTGDCVFANPGDIGGDDRGLWVTAFPDCFSCVTGSNAPTAVAAMLTEPSTASAALRMVMSVAVAETPGVALGMVV